jgi:DNA-directed RNA polymerase I, II, and III subunit RPABC1
MASLAYSFDPLFNVYRVYKTLGEMLVDRNYNIKKSEPPVPFETDFDTFKDYENIFSSFVVANNKNNQDKILVYFCQEPKMSAKNFKSLIAYLEEIKIKHCILIISKSMTDPAKKEQSQITDYWIELFEQNELIVNFTKSIYSSAHFCLSNEEKQEFLTKNKISESQLPRILCSDPVCRYYGIKRGQIIKIVTEDQGSKMISYRLAN